MKFLSTLLKIKPAIKQYLEPLKKLEDEVKDLKKQNAKLTETLKEERDDFKITKAKWCFDNFFIAEENLRRKNDLENKNQELTKELKELQLKFTEIQNELKITKRDEIEFRKFLFETRMLKQSIKHQNY